MEMHVPTIGMAVGHFHGTDIADFMRPAEKVLDAPMAPGLAPNLLRHLDDILQRIGALMPDRERAEHHAPIMFATVLHKRLHILETTGLNLVITDRADPNGTAGLQAGQTGAMRFIVEKPLPVSLHSSQPHLPGRVPRRTRRTVRRCAQRSQRSCA